MKVSLRIEIGCGLEFSVEHDVQVLSDFRKLLQKSDAKVREVCKVMPELAAQRVVKARIAVEQPKQTAAAV